MKRWFRAQPIHRKLVITSMVKTTVVLTVAMIALLVVHVLAALKNQFLTGGPVAGRMPPFRSTRPEAGPASPPQPPQSPPQ